MTCLDTTFLIELLRGDERAERKYEEMRRDRESGQLCTTIINAYELDKGANLTTNPRRNMELIGDLLASLVVLNLDLESVRLGAELHSKLQAKGRLIGEFDILIAAICISNRENLLTNDSDFASVPKLGRAAF